MPKLLESLWNAVPRLTLTGALDILLVAILIYQALILVRGRRSAHILSGIGILLLFYVVSLLAGLQLLRSILETLAPYTAFALIVMFQSDIRRMLARIGERPWLSLGSSFQNRETADEIVLAATHLAAHKTGALIVMERDIGLRTFVESGVPIDSQVTRDLLLAIFHPGAPLHDGAVIVQGGRVAAAACFLPLTMNPELSSKLGTRHRAAIGITEEADCLSIIVSEERGAISIASHGEIESDVTPERLAEALGAAAPRKSPAQAGGSRVREDVRP